MQDPNSLKTYLRPDSFCTSTIVFFAYCLPRLTVETAVITGSPSEDDRPVVLSLTRRPSCFYRPSSILSKSFCKWTIFKNIAVCVVHDPPDFRRSFFSSRPIQIMQIHQYSISGIHQLKNLHRRIVSNLSACLYATIHLSINLKHLRLFFFRRNACKLWFRGFSLIL